MILDYVALGVIFFIVIGATAVIVVVGSLPGKIARQRNHPWPAAVNVASWIGLATGILWPLALIWAYLPVPQKQDNFSAPDSVAETANAPPMEVSATAPASSEDVAKLQEQLVALQATIQKLKAPAEESKA